MKILDSSAGALTNFEVLDMLRSRGAGKDPTRVIASVSASEFKVFDYLEQTVSCNQTREICHEFVEECQKFDLAKAEILNIVNIRPLSEVEINPILEDYESGRDLDNIEELIETIPRILPPPPRPSQVEESKNETVDGGEETAAGNEEEGNKEETEILESNTNN